MTAARPEHRIDYIEIMVRDVAKAKRFYGTAFGWTFEDFGPDYASFKDGGIGGGFNGTEAPHPGGPLVILYTSALEATRDRVASAGGRIVREIFEFPGGRRFHFADPDGNELAAWSDR